MRSSLRAGALLASCFLLLFAGDCSIDGSKFASDDGGDNGGTDDGDIDTDLTDPAAVIEAHEQIWKEQDYAAYEALLDDEFEFYPLSEDVADFPWMDSDSWEKSTELGMASNMFDDGFAGSEQPVDLIEMTSTVQTAETNDAGNTEVRCSAVGRVMWNATDGKSFDTRFVFELVSRDGFLR